MYQAKEQNLENRVAKIIQFAQSIMLHFTPMSIYRYESLVKEKESYDEGFQNAIEAVYLILLHKDVPSLDYLEQGIKEYIGEERVKELEKIKEEFKEMLKKNKK